MPAKTALDYWTRIRILEEDLGTKNVEEKFDESARGSRPLIAAKFVRTW